jgi:hypothetical protein
MARAGAVAAVLAIVPTLMPAPARADAVHKLDTTVGHAIGGALAGAIARALPVPSASSGITFTFDKTSSAFVRETDVAGQLFLERARPIGRGKLNLSLTYQWVRLDTFDGKDLRNLHDLTPLVTPRGARYVIPRVDLSLTTQQLTTSATYGLTDDCELNLTVPLESSDFRFTGSFHNLGGTLDFPPSHQSVQTFGVGDVFLRGKYRLLALPAGDVAAGVVLRLPAGSARNFQGTGDFEASPMLYASTVPLALAPGVRTQAYLNAGLNLVADDGRQSEGRGGVGVDLLFGERLTFSTAVLAREPFGRLVSPGFFDVPRADGTRRPLLGLDPGRPSYYDLAVGVRVNLWRDTVFGIANVIVPLNRDGMRSDAIPLVGVEATF